TASSRLQSNQMLTAGQLAGRCLISLIMPIVILSAGRDHQLSRKRDQALIAAGYNVVSANNSPEIINKLFNGDFDAVILCNTIPNEERRRLASIIKSYSPSTPVVVISEMQGL